MEVESVNELFELEPNQVLNWIEQVRSGEIVVPEGFNWELASEVIGNGPSYSSPDWRRVGIVINEYLANKTKSKRNKERFMERAMMRRVNLIRTLGTDPNDSMRYEREITEWFFSNLSMELEAAKAKSEAFFSKPAWSDDLPELRQIKQRLNIIRRLPERTNNQRTYELTEWLQLRLP